MLLTGFFIWSLTHVTTLLSQRLNEPIHTLLNYLRSKQNIIKHCLKRHAASLAYCFSCKLSPTYSTYLFHYTATHLLYKFIWMIDITPFPLFCQVPLKSINCPSSFFKAISPYILVFCEPPLIKIGFFSELPQC